MTDNQKLSPSTAKQEANAFRFSLIMAISMGFISVLLVILFGFPKNLLDLNFLAIMVAVTSAVSAILSRRGYATLGVLLIIASLLLACIVASVLFDGFGPVLAIVILIISFGAGALALPRNYANIVNAISVVFALLFLAMDIFQPIERLPNEAPMLTWTVAGVLALIFGLGIVWNFRNYNFRTKLMISFVFMTTVTLMILALFNQFTNTNILAAALGRELNNQAVNRSLNIGDQINQQAINLNVMAVNTLIKESATTSTEAYTGDEQAILSEIQQLDQQWLTADDNDPLVREVLNHESAHELQDYVDVSPGNLEVFLTDRYGALIGATNRTSDYYQADEEWWQNAYNDGLGGIYISDPEFDESVDDFVVLIAIPIFSEDDEGVVGILRTNYQLSFLANVLSKPIGETGQADLYIPGDPPQYVHEGAIESVEPAVYRQLTQNANQNYFEMTYHDAENVLSQAPIATTAGNSVVDELDWFIVAHQTSDEIFAPIDLQTRTALGLVIVIVGIAALIALGLAHVLVTPITRLTTTAEEIAAGDITLTAEVNTQDEVGTLAAAFNEMTAQLRNILASLEERITARTRDLELAAEVGRRLSMVSETEAMLTEAVNIIRDRFDLYYTQVYLTDTAGRALILRAGTGDVGRTLINRSHRLPLDMSSLNGIAASERRTILVEDTSTSTLYRPNPLLPDTRSEMSVPLIVGGLVVGVLNMQSTQPGALNAENQAAFEALAGSLAISIANAGLFEQAEQARITVEEQTRRLTSEGWADFLDAIERSERVAFTYDRENVTPLPQTLPGTQDETTLVTPIRVAGASVGQLQFTRDEAWTEDDFAISNAVAQQVAQQIENLRLLAQSQQYQAEAQEALRRLTREGWAEYQKETQAASGFVYQDHEVKPLSKSDNDFDEALNYDVKVRDEAIAKLSIAGLETLSEEDAELVAAINEQLSAHLENLRLSQQTEQALAETEDLYQGSAKLVRASNYDEILETLVQATSLRNLDLVSMVLVDSWTPAGDPEMLLMVSNWTKGTLPETIPPGTRYPIDNPQMAKNMKPDKIIITPDYFAEDDINEATLERVRKSGVRGSVTLPLFVGDRWIGSITAASTKVLEWSEDDVRQALTFAGQAATAVQNQRLFEQTQTRAQHELTLRQITTEVYAAPDAESILRRAAEEISQRLGLEAFVYLEKPDEIPTDSSEAVASEVSEANNQE